MKKNVSIVVYQRANGASELAGGRSNLRGLAHDSAPAEHPAGLAPGNPPPIWTTPAAGRRAAAGERTGDAPYVSVADQVAKLEEKQRRKRELAANERAQQEKKKKRDGREAMSRSLTQGCLLYTSPSPRDRTRSRMPSSA